MALLSVKEYHLMRLHGEINYENLFCGIITLYLEGQSRSGLYPVQEPRTN
jgi:hypothetical protein